VLKAFNGSKKKLKAATTCAWNRCRLEVPRLTAISPSVTTLPNAPIDLQTYRGGAELAYDAALDQDGAVGRFVLLGVTYRF
jgi:hypothetical protein